MASDEPLTVRNPYLLNPDSRSSIKPIDNPRLDLLDEYPRTLRGHLEFVEWVCEEVCAQADYKKARASNQSITMALDGIYWAQALTRARQLPSFLPDQGRASQLPQQIEIVDSILQRQLSIRTVEQVAELLLPAVRSLRDAVEDFWQKKGNTTSKVAPGEALQKIRAATEKAPSNTPVGESPEPDPSDEPGQNRKRKLKKPNPWHDAGSSPPAHFDCGPLTGNKGQLARWILSKEDYRSLNTPLRNDSFWGREDVGTCSIWFKDQKRFADANKRKLIDERGDTNEKH